MNGYINNLPGSKNKWFKYQIINNMNYMISSFKKCVFYNRPRKTDFNKNTNNLLTTCNCKYLVSYFSFIANIILYTKNTLAQ